MQHAPDLCNESQVHRRQSYVIGAANLSTASTQLQCSYVWPQLPDTSCEGRCDHAQGIGSRCIACRRLQNMLWALLPRQDAFSKNSCQLTGSNVKGSASDVRSTIMQTSEGWRSTLIILLCKPVQTFNISYHSTSYSEFEWAAHTRNK